ncbi:MAG: NTP transferase domain-containing protein [Verrucomicrobia bacterium]|nr:NTP transferase domain-containing protein [Verrucomicrobiota bacterium]MBV9298024.1 NTP transferase domain-containing protein [Verrucomicrobiota bacterium]MBV9642546.1 NTP transferase domain-containing protein [Verrucomicrobiota bacterium]
MIHRVRKAFVLGAGLGVRMRPLTNLLPKPLLPIFGKPLITFALDHLRQAGIEKFWVNLHHLPQQFAAHFPNNEYNGTPLELVHEAALLETGGGIKNIQDRIGNEAFVVYSGDILTDLPVQLLIEEHYSKRNDVTLALRTTSFSAKIRWQPETGRVVNLLGPPKSSQPGQYDFAGISVWNPSVFARIPRSTSISLVPIIIEWMKSGGKIGGIPLEESRWFNVGSRKDYLSAHQIIARERWVPDYLRGGSWPIQIDISAQISPETKILGGSFVGARCNIGRDVLLEDSILFAGSSIPRRTTLRSCIVAGIEIEPGEYLETDFV